MANGVVYFGSADNNVYALNAATGALLWSYPISGLIVIPAVANGSVYVGTGTLYALNAKTGALLWNRALNQDSSAPAIANGVVYISAGNGALNDSVYALNATTGVILWNIPLKGLPPLPPWLRAWCMSPPARFMRWTQAPASRCGANKPPVILRPSSPNGVVYATSSGVGYAFSVK